MYIEIDPGYGRSGLAFDDFDAIKELKSTLESCKNLTFEGFYTHCGHTYKCRSKDAVKSLIEPIFASLGNLKQTFGGKICFGILPPVQYSNILTELIRLVLVILRSMIGCNTTSVRVTQKK